MPRWVSPRSPSDCCCSNVGSRPSQNRSKPRCDALRRDVERNDLDAILSHVYSGATETLARARSEFPRYSFRVVNIKRNVEVQLQAGAEPPAADVTFNVVVDVTERNSEIPYHVPRFVHVTLRKEGGRWKVATYSHDEPQSSLFNRPPQ